MNSAEKINRAKKSGIRRLIETYRLPISLTTIYLLLSIAGICYHEIWLDEAQHFLLARDSNSLSELIRNCRYEGHPLLWNIMLFAVTRISDDVIYMQVLHILINCITVFFLAESKLSIVEKILIIFSYFIFYEYNIISRNYGLSALLMIASVLYLLNQHKSIIHFSFILLLLANTHLYGLLFSMALFVCILFYHRQLLQQPFHKIMIASLILLVGWIISILSILPPQDYAELFAGYEVSGYLSAERIIKTVSVCLKGIFYIPAYQAGADGVHNSLWLFTRKLHDWHIYLLSAMSILIPLWIIRKNKFAVMLFILFFCLYAGANYFLPLVNGIRYFGFFYVTILICYLIALPVISKTGKLIAGIIFLLQFANGLYMYYIDLLNPFSQSKQTVAILEKLSSPETELLILDSTIRPGISAYTGNSYVGMESGEQLTYCKWDQQLPVQVLKMKIDSILSVNQNVLIISNRLHPELLDTTKLRLAMPLTNSMIRGENAAIYWYDH